MPSVQLAGIVLAAILTPIAALLAAIELFHQLLDRNAARTITAIQETWI